MFMRKCRWVRVALVAIWVALPTYASALGLGEIEVESALNEKFSAKIEVLEAGGLQPAEILVSMASREDFERVGVERFFYLTNLKFSVSMTDRGAEVSVTSSQPIAEPYLNFIVEVLWPNGRLLKEFTVLLDPPTFSQAAAPAVSAPDQRVSQAPRSSAASEQPAAARSGTRVNLDTARAPSAPRRDGTMTTRDDTLWRIASQSLPGGVTVNQQMLAIKRLNPEAFIGDNVNLLKAGYVLRMPSAEQARELAADEAKLMVSAENEAWRSGEAVTASPQPQVAQANQQERVRSAVDATRAPAPAAGESGEAQGQVRIVANSAELSPGTGSGQNAPAQLLESNETLNRQVDELTYQLDREKEIASNQIELKDRQLEVKDQELAALQERLSAMEAELEAAEENASQNQNQNQTTADTEAPETPWWASPMVLGGVIGVLVLALAGALIALRRKSNEEEEYESYAYASDTEAYADAEQFEDDENTRYRPVEPAVGAATAHALAEPAPTDDGEHQEVDIDETEAIADAGDQNTQTTDVVGEADIYIAYGRFGQASSLLLGALAVDPNRHDVRLKLLEVCVEANDSEQFAEHAQYLLEHCDDPDVLHACRELEARLDEAPASDASDDDLAAEDAPADPGELDGEFALDLDDADLSLEGDADGGGVDADGIADLDIGDDDTIAFADDATTALDDDTTVLADADPSDAEVMDAQSPQEDDFELEFDTAEEETADLGGDLGLDFQPEIDGEDTADEQLEAATEPSAESELEFDLDLDDLDDIAELDDTPAGDAQSAASEGTSDEELDEFDLPDASDSDVNATKLDLAEAYIDMGDSDGARDILTEVIEEGDNDQQARAREMLQSLAS